MIGFVFFVLNGILSFFSLVLFIYMIMSWLLAFDIINTRNPTVYRISAILDMMTAPILEPFRRLIPSMGGIDLSFLVAILVIKGMQYYLLQAAENSLTQLLGMS